MAEVEPHMDGHVRFSHGEEFLRVCKWTCVSQSCCTGDIFDGGRLEEELHFFLKTNCD